MSSISWPSFHRGERSNHRRLRVAVMLAAAAAAIAWRTRTAISSAFTLVRDRAEPRVGGVAVVERPEERAGSLHEAGIDATGTFRPDRVEPDSFGVVVTDDTPAGLEGGAHWVKGDGTAVCPDEHPVKGNASSRIYHLPGEPSYARTIPEICFASEDDAVAAGFRARAR